MKLLTLIISLTLFASCSQSTSEKVESPTITTKDTLIQFDSITNGYGGYILYERTEKPIDILSSEIEKTIPLDHTQSQELLGDLGREDTLKIFAEFSQCGEFGGNREYILIYRGDSTMECVIVKDSVACRFDNNGKKFFRVEKETFTLSKSASKSVTDYLELLLRYSLKDREWYANVAGYFSATITRGVNYRKDFSIDVMDSEGIWIYFDILKNEIKTTANNR